MLQLTSQPHKVLMATTVVTAARERARKVFAAHVGQGPEVPGYGATGWRQWLICGASCNCGWFVVSKANPLATPRHYPCSLELVKAHLKAGNAPA